MTARVGSFSIFSSLRLRRCWAASFILFLSSSFFQAIKSQEGSRTRIGRGLHHLFLPFPSRRRELEREDHRPVPLSKFRSNRLGGRSIPSFSPRNVPRRRSPPKTHPNGGKEYSLLSFPLLPPLLPSRKERSPNLFFPRSAAKKVDQRLLPPPLLWSYEGLYDSLF